MTGARVRSGTRVRLGAACRVIAAVVGATSVLAMTAFGGVQDLSQVSKADPGFGTTVPNGASAQGRVSADGRYVVFTSYASNLVAGQVDVGATLDVFLHDRVTGTTTLVSHVPGAPTTTGNEHSYHPVISADGAWVAFVSTSRNLVAGTDANDNPDASFGEIDNGDMDVFLYERATGLVTLVSHVPGDPGTTGNLGSDSPVISADGAYVAFVSWASDLTAGDTNRAQDVFLYSRASGGVTLVSHVPGSPDTPGNKGALRPVISADGGVVAFASAATDLADADTNGALDVFVYERATGNVTLVSHAAGGPMTTGNAGSSDPSLSADGALVAFTSAATDLVEGAITTRAVYLHERATGTTTLVSHALGAPDTTANAPAALPVLSADGAFVAFVSAATDLAPGGGTNGTRQDVFLHERATGTITLVSHVPGAPATELNGSSRMPAISADGEVVVFSLATQFIPGEPVAVDADLYVHHRATGTTTLVDHAHPARAPSVSADGSVVVFSNSINPTGDQFDFHYLRGDVFAFVFTPEPGPSTGPDLVERTVSNPPATAVGGSKFSVTDTVLNRGTTTAAASTTTYYLSPVPAKTTDSRALGTRSVAALAAGASSVGTRLLTVPTATRPATYYLVVCADDLARVGESNEGNNCTAAATTLTVAGPDLVVTAVSDPPATARRGGRFTVTETVANQGTSGAASSQTRFYLARDPRRETWTTLSSRLLAGTRTVPTLAAGASFTPPLPLTVGVPTSMPPGTYFLVGCADDTQRVIEARETNNCTASAGQVRVP